MKKIYSTFLFFTFILVFSTFATDRGETSVEIIKVKVSQMSDVIGVLEKNNVNLKEAAVFIDFDETFVKKVLTYKGHEFILLASPDKARTYKPVFAPAFEKSPYNLDTFDFRSLPESKYDDIHERYEILDDEGEVKNFVCKLCEYAGFAGVCSALPGDDSKDEMMEYVGLDKGDYIYAEDGKAQAIYGKIIQLGKKITTVVLIDNSEKFSINPFLEKMPELVKDSGFPHLKIIGIEHTKFGDMLTQEAIEEELTLLQTLHNK